ncbi:hypothetical protein ACFQ6H_27175 [Rhodococcus sp. NPDC056506]|uniref:hypothetical protein n=1 Tax=Rhodococcus sp. NPDC056506 TaxID=3345844 RepID=UPI00366B0124
MADEATPEDYTKKLIALQGRDLPDNELDRWKHILGIDRGLLAMLADWIPSIGFLVEKIDKVIKDIAHAITGVVGGGLSAIGTWVEDFVNGVNRTVNQIGEVFRGLVVTPINNIVSGVRDWFLGLWQKGKGGKAEETFERAEQQGKQIIGHDEDIDNLDKNKAEIVDVPNIAMWMTLNPLEDPTFPRFFLNRSVKSVGDKTSSDSHAAFGTHNHSVINNRDPYYLPAKGRIELGYIRVPRLRSYDTVGIIVGAESNPCPMYITVYHMKSDGSLEMVWTSGNISGLITSQKTEYRMNLTEIFEGVEQPKSMLNQGGDYVAVGVLQTGNGNVRGLAGIEMDSVAIPAGIIPKKQNAMFVAGSNPPDMIPGSAIDFDNSTYAPWFCMGQKLSNDPPPKIKLGPDFFDRPDGGLGVNWATRGNIGITDGAAGVRGGNDGVRSALWVRPTNTDNHAVEVIVKNESSAGPRSCVILRSNNMFTRGLVYMWNRESRGFARCVGENNFQLISGTLQGAGIRSGARLKVVANGSAYYAYLNGEQIGAWNPPDPENFPIGPEYRFVGMAAARALWVDSPAIEEWQAFDL